VGVGIRTSVPGGSETSKNREARLAAEKEREQEEDNATEERMADAEWERKHPVKSFLGSKRPRGGGRRKTKKRKRTKKKKRTKKRKSRTRRK
jgi:hypothetical protein